MSSFLRQFSNAKVLVVGDVMLDRYWSGGTKRISPEAPVPVVKIDDTYERLGGSGNVAANIAALGAEAQLLALTGADSAGKAIATLAEARGIVCNIIHDSGSETPVKLRVISQQQQLIRLDFEKQNSSVKVTEELLSMYSSLVRKTQLVVLSDYGKGTISDPLKLIQIANDAGRKVIVDPKGNDFSKYKGAYLITPNFKEFENVVGACGDEEAIERKGKNLIDELDLNALLVTRGDKGMSLIRRDDRMFTLSADSQEVYDVTGAGDTVCGVCAVAIAAGADMESAIDLANSAAGIVVNKFGTATVSVEELGRARNPVAGKILNSDAWIQLLNDKKSQGEVLIFTNGCFDILHAGHVDYLNKAKALGDILIVAVNSDSSVRGLKGDSRPVNVLENRMAVLAGLEAVDYVISFSEATPLSLIEKISPDVLVKGGDYVAADVVGAQHVESTGGRVAIVPFVAGLSTSSTLEKLREGDRGDKT